MYMIAKINGNYTIFNEEMQQYCDKDGTTLKYENYSQAKQVCDLLNEE